MVLLISIVGYRYIVGTKFVKMLPSNACKKILWLKIFDISYLVNEILIRNFVLHHFQAFLSSEKLLSIFLEKYQQKKKNEKFIITSKNF